MSYNSKYTGQEVEDLLNKIDGKQDAISDLDAIRSGASKGATALQSIPEEYVTEADLEDKDYAPMSVLDNKVDKVSGKGLSTEDFTSALKAKLESLSNYNDTEIAGAVSSLQTQINTLVSGNADDAINSFNEIIAFLDGVKDTQDLSSIIASIEQQVAGKMDKVTLATVATSGDYNDLNNKPAIPTKTSELTNDSTFITSTDNVASATKLQTIRYINGLPFDGTSNVVSYAVCTTGASTSIKTVNISNFNLITGSQVRVKFNNNNTASAPTLNVGSTGAKRMSYKGSLITNANFSFSTAKIYTFTYDGTYWVLEGDWDEVPKTNILTCEFMGEVGDVIWSDYDQDRIEYIADWMEALSMGKVCVLDFDEYENTYAMVHAINYHNDATYGIGKVYFSYVFEGYLYDVEYESVSLPVTMTIVSKTKIGGEGGGGITVETDPIFSASPAATITEEKIATWDAKSEQGEKGDKGDAGVGVQSVAQTTTSNADGGSNIVTVTLTDGTKSTFTVKNGSKGSQGIQGIQGEQGPKGDKGDKGDTGADGANGKDGADGATFTPSVDAAGNLSWSNDKGLTNPPTVNIKGPKGDAGEGGGSSEGGGSTTKEVVMVSSGTIDLLEPNKIYLLDLLNNSLQISEIAYPEGAYAEYCIMSIGTGFGSSSMSLIFPDDMPIYWVGDDISSISNTDIWELSIVYTQTAANSCFKCVLTKFT